MRFTETSLPGAWLVDLEPREDERGFFARTFDAREFEEHGLRPMVAQCNLSYNRTRGTLRGLHFQVAPATEAKYLRCIRGEIHSVIVDLRPDSPTYLRHFATQLSAASRRAIYVPDMFAASFQTLADDSEIAYQVSEYYTPATERGLRYNDPALGIEWPLPVAVISDKDASWPLIADGGGR
jgi:dTDP-4-dehydrorhamnose 3,5-epimerase